MSEPAAPQPQPQPGPAPGGPGPQDPFGLLSRLDALLSLHERAPAPAPGLPAAADSAPPAPDPAYAPPAGTVAKYTYFDPYTEPQRDRDQVVLVTGHEDDGQGGTRYRGFVLGHAEDAASFAPGQLAPPD